MMNPLKETLRPFIPQQIFNALERRRQNKAFDEWQRNSCPDPPPHKEKQNTINEYRQKSGYSILIETGTFMGQMVEAQKTKFKKIISIEVAEDLYEKAKKRFQKDKNVLIIHGDSGKVLPKIISDINEPAIFWLDGHFSAEIRIPGVKDCPIFDELDAIFNSKQFNHILLIDDAKMFIGNDAYPTIENLTKYVKSKNENYNVEVKNDIIRYKI